MRNIFETPLPLRRAGSAGSSKGSSVCHRRAVLPGLPALSPRIAASDRQFICHSSTSITAKYDRTWQDKAKEAARMRVIPYLSREWKNKKPPGCPSNIILFFTKF
jgi:hypothetical protein